MTEKMEIKDTRRLSFTIIENAILEDQDLSVYAKLAYAMLCKFAGNLTRTSWPSHSTLAALLNCSKPKLLAALKELENGQYIAIQRRKEAGQHLTNIYTVVGPPVGGVVNDVYQGSKPRLHELYSLNSFVRLPASFFSRVVDYLNEKAGTNYSDTAPETCRLIKTRIKEGGYTEQDFYTVIDKKVAEWKGSGRWRQYLRPKTLFGPAFDDYLNELPPEPKKQRRREAPEYKHRASDEDLRKGIKRKTVSFEDPEPATGKGVQTWCK